MNLRRRITHHPHTNEQAYNEIMKLTYKEREALLTLKQYKPEYLSEHSIIILNKYERHKDIKGVIRNARLARRAILGK